MSLWLSPAALTATHVYVPVSLSWALGSASTRPPDSTWNRSTAPSDTPQCQTQAGGAIRAHFKMEHLFCHCLPPSPCTPVFSSNPDLQKQNSDFMSGPRELLAFSRLCRIWTPLPPTSFKDAVTPFVCALSCPYRTQFPLFPFRL